VSASGMVRKILWLHSDEAEALRLKAFKERRAESEIMREALRAGARKRRLGRQACCLLRRLLLFKSVTLAGQPLQWGLPLRLLKFG